MSLPSSNCLGVVRPSMATLIGSHTYPDPFRFKSGARVKSNSSIVAQSCPTLWDPMDCSPSGFSVHGILQERIRGWVAIRFSRGSSRPRSLTRVSYITGRFFTIQDSKQSACNAGDLASILGSGRCLGEGNGYPLQQPCLENSMDRESSLGLVNFKSSSQGIRMKKENWKREKEKLGFTQRSTPARKFKILLWCHFWLSCFAY